MATKRHAWSLPAVAALGLILAGCASTPQFSAHHGKFRTGRPNYTVAPYQVNGVWYYPKVDYSYDETGTASWYGQQFDQRPTSDGEIFDMNQLSAAHKTLPLPSVVEVTNLQNGRELRLRVNDRGPFVDGRLIDLSRRAAQLLGFERAGTAPVRVRVLKDDSIQVAAAAMRGEMGPVGIAEGGPARQTALAAAAPPPAPRRAPAPVIAMAAAQAPRTAPAPVISMAAAQAPRTAPAPVISMAAAEAPRPAPPPGRAPPPVIQMAAAEPAPLRTGEIAATPPPAEHPRAAAPAPPPVAPRRSASAAAPHRYWPSLIASAHAETLRAPRPTVAPQERRRIFVQAGAFAVPGNAQRVRERIAALGRVEVVRGTGNDALYRVRLGPFANAAEAKRSLGRVIDRGYPGARVVGE